MSNAVKDYATTDNNQRYPKAETKLLGTYATSESDQAIQASETLGANGLCRYPCTTGHERE
jgi:hypothetical protein